MGRTRPQTDWRDVEDKLQMLNFAQVAMLPEVILLRLDLTAPGDALDTLPSHRLQAGLNARVARMIGEQLIAAANMLEGKGEAN